ncbi:MAG: hypothetical protein ACXVAX_03780 [Pseudobdellovibrio sp.]
MFLKKYKYVGGLILAAAVIGCSSKPPKTDTEMVNKVERVEQKALYFGEIEFKPNSSDLTEGSKAQLDSVIDEAQRNNVKVDKVSVLSWSDKEYPANDKVKLSKDQQNLADKRNEVIKNYYKNTRSVSIDTYNMAKQPNILSKWLNTRDNKLKNTLVAAGLPTTTEEATASPHKASHALILVNAE